MGVMVYFFIGNSRYIYIYIFKIYIYIYIYIIISRMRAAEGHET